MAAKFSRQSLLAYASGRRRAEIKAREERDVLAERFEQLNGETLAEIRSLRRELVNMRAIDDAMLERARDERQWLH